MDLRAFWRRPAAYLDPRVRAGISTFHLCSEAELAEPLRRLRRDLENGRWVERNRASWTYKNSISATASWSPRRLRRPRRSLPLSRASERIAGVAPRATRQRGKMTDTLRRIGGRNHEPHTSESARAIIQRLKRVFNERDVAGVAAVYTEDIEYDDDAWPEPVKGHAGVERLFGALWRMESDCRFELVDGPYLSEDGGRVAVRWRVVGTMAGPWDVPESPALAPTGGAFAGEIGGFYELEGDRIRRGRVIANQLEMGIQFGAMPPPGSRAQRLGAAMQRLNARRMRRRAKA